MPEADNFFAFHAAQHANDMRRAETLPRVVHRRQHGTRGVRPVQRLDRIATDVAISAGFGRIAEIAQQHLAAAFGRLAIGDQRVEPLMFAPLAVVVALFLLDEDAPHADIVQAVEHQRFRGCAVAARAANFLVIGFRAGG